MVWTLLELLGVALVVAGIAFWSVPAGLIAAGVFALAIGILRGDV